MKKILLIGFLLIACFVTQSVSAYDFSEENEDGVTIYYNINNPTLKTCEVTMKEPKIHDGEEHSYTDYEGDVKIPATANGYQVVGIAAYAFAGCQNVTSVTIPSTVTSIGKRAFEGCRGMTSITSQIKNVFETESEAFLGCTQATLYVPYGYAEKYASAEDWNRLNNIVEYFERIPLAMACNDKGRVVINREINFTNKMADVNIFDGMENVFSFAPYENCELGQVLLNGLDITKSVKENRLKKIIRENSHMMVIFVPQGADVNRDGVIDVADVVALVNFILGQ